MTYSIVEIKSFANVADAWDYISSLNYECVDNCRFAFIEDRDEMLAYEMKKSDGCCGYHDENIIVNGMFAIIGCNYGH